MAGAAGACAMSGFFSPHTAQKCTTPGLPQKTQKDGAEGAEGEVGEALGAAREADEDGRRVEAERWRAPCKAALNPAGVGSGEAGRGEEEGARLLAGDEGVGSLLAAAGLRRRPPMVCARMRALSASVRPLSNRRVWACSGALAALPVRQLRWCTTRRSERKVRPQCSHLTIASVLKVLRAAAF